MDELKNLLFLKSRIEINQEKKVNLGIKMILENNMSNN